MSLRERLEKALRDAGINKSQLAARVGVTRASVSDWFTGATKTIEGANLTKAAEALGVDAHWLATGEGLRAAQTQAGYSLSPIRTWEHEDDLPPGEYAFIPGIIYFTPALIINGIFIVHNVLDSLTVLCQDEVVGSTTGRENMIVFSEGRGGTLNADWQCSRVHNLSRVGIGNLVTVHNSCKDGIPLQLGFIYLTPTGIKGIT